MASELENVRGFVQRLEVYRFRDCVAVSILDTCDGGSGRPVKSETVYLSRTVAEALAEALATGARDVAAHRFSASGFGRVTVTAADPIQARGCNSSSRDV